MGTGGLTVVYNKMPNVASPQSMMLVCFCLSARGGAAPGRPGLLIFEKPAKSAGTPANVTGSLAGRKGRGLDMLPDDGREKAQHAAEAAQRQAEEAMKDQIDAVAKAESAVNAGASSPPPSDTQVAQRDLEHAQAEREAAQLAKEQEIRDAEEKAQLEADAAAKKASRAGDSPTVGKTGLSNSTSAADTARARAEHAPRTSAPAASATAEASSPAGQASAFFQAVGFTLYAVVGNALHAAQEVAPAWTLGLPLWAIALIGLSSIALCVCCVHLCGGKNDHVKARRRTSLYASMGLPQHFGAGHAQAATSTPAKDRQGHHHKAKAKYRHYGENAHGEGGKVHW